MPYNPGVRNIGGELLYSGISRGLESFGQGIKERTDRERQEAKLFKALQEQAEITGIATKDQTQTWDLGRLQGAVRGHTIQQHQEEQALLQRMRQFELNQAQRIEAQRRRQAMALSEANEQFHNFNVTYPDASRAEILGSPQGQALLMQDPAGLEQRLQTMFPDQGQIPVDRLGKAQPVQGAPGALYVPTSRGGGQILLGPTEEGQEGGGLRTALMPDGSPSGYLMTPDGKYLRDPKVSDPPGPDPADFDANKDGTLSNQEYAQWLLSSKMGGTAYPGMKVKPSASTTQGTEGGGGLWEDFQRGDWKDR